MKSLNSTGPGLGDGVYEGDGPKWHLRHQGKGKWLHEGETIRLLADRGVRDGSEGCRGGWRGREGEGGKDGGRMEGRRIL